MPLPHLAAALLVVLLTHTSSVYAGVRPRWADVTLRDGVYKNVLVAVGHGVQQDDGLIEQIKTLFRDASRELAVATGGRVRFGHIDILVPTSWNTTNVTSATVQRFGNADFIVAPAKLSHGDAPYTKRVGGCGKRGEYVHITPKYVSDPTYASRWGPRGRTMVHEWAHYWWGVFDEYPTRNKQYYTDPNGELSPVMCPADFPGDWRALRGDPCQAGTPGCRFIPQDPPETGPSFMAFYHLPNVTQFCNESGDHPHNVFAPTKQNKMCNRRSVWSVIQQHADFNPPKCVDSFNKTSGKQVQGGAHKANIHTLAECKTSCIRNSKCLAIDFNIKSNKKCWIHIHAKESKLNSQVDHYKLIRCSLSTLNGHPSERPDTNITFAVVKRRDRVLFVLDDNMKMSHQRLMEGAFSEYIERAEADSRIAVVSFGLSTTLSTVVEWTTINEIRQHNDNTSASDKSIVHSCIGDALYESLMNINETTSQIAGANIVLLTPGKQAGREHCNKTLDTALKDLEKQHVTLHAVFTDDGTESSTIQQAVEATGGRSLRLSSIRENPESAFLRLLAPDEGGTQAKIQLVKKRDTAKSAGEAVSGHVYVDTSCGQDVLFRFGHLDMTQTYNVTVRSPRGLNYTNSKVDKDSGTITVEVNKTEVGKWYYTVKSGDTDSLLTVQTSLECAPSPDAVDIQVTPQMNINRVNFADAGTEYLILAAQVTADELPVDNATVVASVTLGNGTVIDVRLWDNGAGADTDRGDGLYAAYFVHYAGNGSYSVDIAAERTKPSSTSGQKPQHAAFDVFQNQTSTSSNALNVTVPSFQRTAASPPFTVENLPPGEVDLFPPATVTDLDFEIASFEGRTVMLKFTAQGDDLDSGTASLYDIRYVALTDASGAAERLEQLRNDFNSCSVLEPGARPLEAGTTESLRLELRDNDDAELFMVALKVVDDWSQSSDVSNIVVVNFRRPPTTTTTMTTTTTTTTPVTSTTPTRTIGQSLSNGGTFSVTLVQLVVIISVAVGITILIFLCVLCLILRCKRTARGQNQDSSLANIELQTPTGTTGRTYDVIPRDNDYTNSHDTSSRAPRARPPVPPRPDPVGLCDPRHVGVEKRISRRFLRPFSQLMAKRRQSGSYTKTIEPASDFTRSTSNYPPTSGISAESQDFGSRIDPEGGCIPGTPTNAGRVASNPSGISDRTPPPYPVGTTGRMPPPNPVGTTYRMPPPNPVGTTYGMPPPNAVGTTYRMPPPNPVGTTYGMPPPNAVGTTYRMPPPNPVGTTYRMPPPNPVGTTYRMPPPNPIGTTDRTPPPYPVGTTDRIPQPHPNGTNARTLTPTPEGGESSDDYDDNEYPWQRSSGSDYQDVACPARG